MDVDDANELGAHGISPTQVHGGLPPALPPSSTSGFAALPAPPLQNDSMVPFQPNAGQLVQYNNDAGTIVPSDV
eukprot:50346-Eustigmatos_ZCMA.PRE.1